MISNSFLTNIYEILDLNLDELNELLEHLNKEIYSGKHLNKDHTAENKHGEPLSFKDISDREFFIQVIQRLIGYWERTQ